PQKFEYVEVNDRDLMDRWIISKLNSLIKYVNKNLEGYNITEATRSIEKFIDYLTNWYIRLNRKRFWKGEMDKDKISAYFTLYETLLTLSKLIAPFAPFISEDIYQTLKNSNSKESVHLEDYPRFDETKIDSELEKRMEFVIDIVELGRGARKKAQVKVRQPLRKMYIYTMNRENIDEFLDLIKSELNVKEIEFIEDEMNFVEIELKPNYEVVGKRLGKFLKNFEELLSNQKETLYKDLKEKKEFTFEVGDLKEKICEEDLIINKKPKGNYSVNFDKDKTTILDLTLDEELIKEGWVREFLHFIQNFRKESNFEVTDKILLGVLIDKEKENYIKEYENYIKEEALIENILFEEIKDANVKEFEGGKVFIKKI
ncbi:MAG: class I tRNA ligase family protein, partial [Caldisericia bacterium]|nr:class I tRNA ligase family protein [Caldisericia bacterium]